MKKLILGTIIILTSFGLNAQTIDFAALVSFDYQGERLEDVLDDLSERLGINISYSPKMIPLDQEMFVTVDHEEFADALVILFAETPVVYGFIGRQLVLSIDSEKQRAMYLRREPIAAIDDTPAYTPRTMQHVTLAGHRSTSFEMDIPPLSSGIMSEDYIRRESNALLRQAEIDENAFRAQISFIPHMQAITRPWTHTPVNLSFNVLVGVNDNIEGFELGGLVNITRGNMEGMQIAGIGNTVLQRADGFQLAGIVNTVKEHTNGLQLAGVVNYAGIGRDLVQVGGVTSIAKDNVFAQISGVANIADDVKAVQVGGVANVAKNARVQVSAVVNVASRTGYQIGLINIADTTRLSIGLLSFIKSGYRSVEISGEEVLHANLNFRLGTRSFYNILHASATYDISSWAFGYGIGTSVRTGNKGNYVQLELLSRYVNENVTWSDELNLLNQFNINWDLKVGSQMSVSFGPTFNVFVSKLYNAETDSYGSQLPPYAIFDETFNRSNGPLNVKAWIGFHVGLRFNSRDHQIPLSYQY